MDTKVKGYGVWGVSRYEYPDGIVKESAFELLFAETADGRLFRTGPHRPNANFDRGCWVEINSLPDTARFCGNYVISV